MRGTADKERGDPLRIGLLGGTFDPVHLGHLRTALEVAENLTLECVYLVPASVPPHKERGAVASFADRIAMVRMAIQGTRLLGALDVEGRREGLSYTVQTLQELRGHYPDDLELFFILGTDAFLDIHMWKDFRSLFELSHFVLVERPGFASESLESYLDSLDVAWTVMASGDYRFTSSGNLLIRKTVTGLDISSTHIREIAAAGRSVRFLVPESVEAYLTEEGLYDAHGEHG
jgi:nicotinate-nucleotide adenylyltransferase